MQRPLRRFCALLFVVLASRGAVWPGGGDAAAGSQTFTAVTSPGSRLGAAERRRGRRVALADSAAVVDFAAAGERSAVEDRKALKQLMAKHGANDTRAWGSLALSFGLWAVGLYAVHVTGGHWLALCYGAMTVARWFMVFHDASHLSFFEDREMNERLADVSQFFVNYNWRQWADVHNSHHKNFGDSTVKDTSLTIFFSEAELEVAPWYVRAIHRFVREPLWFYPLASFFVFFINKPLTHLPMRILFPGIIFATLGVQTGLNYLIVLLLAGMIGVVSFHLQHHCNAPYRVAGPRERSSVDAALAGSTRIPLVFPFNVFSFGIEYHHIHHLDVRVPGYNLQACDAEGGKLGLWEGRVNTVGAWQAFRSLFHTQFAGSKKVADESGPPRFISFWPWTALGMQA